jgi:hypothetical protein
MSCRALLLLAVLVPGPALAASAGLEETMRGFEASMSRSKQVLDVIDARTARRRVIAAKPNVRLAKTIAGTAGAIVAAPVGAALVGTMGTLSQAVDSVGVSSTKVAVVERVDGRQFGIKVRKVPGIVKTALFGATGLGLAAVGLGPEHWPLLSHVTQPLVQHLHLGHITGGFVAGAAVRVAAKTLWGATRGIAVGLRKGARLGDKIAETVVQNVADSRDQRLNPEQWPAYPK